MREHRLERAAENALQKRLALRCHAVLFRDERMIQIGPAFPAEPKGVLLDEALRSSLEDLDGTFSYLVATRDSIGYAKDKLVNAMKAVARFIELLPEGMTPEEIETDAPNPCAS